MLDRGPPPGPERGVVSCPIGGVLEIERPVAGERDPARRQPVHPEAAPRGADADVRRQLTGTRTDRRRARAEEQGALVGVPAAQLAAEEQPLPPGVAPGRALGEREVGDAVAVVITYDEGGGWFDHVRPPAVDRFGLGTRVPALVVSPYARRGLVAHGQYEHASILKLIEWRWNLEPLTARDRAAGAFLEAFDFSQPPRPPVALP